MLVCLYHVSETMSIGLLTRGFKNKENEELFKELGGHVHYLSNPMDLIDDPYFEEYMFVTDEDIFKQLVEK